MSDDDFCRTYFYPHILHAESGDARAEMQNEPRSSSLGGSQKSSRYGAVRTRLYVPVVLCSTNPMPLAWRASTVYVQYIPNLRYGAQCIGYVLYVCSVPVRRYDGPDATHDHSTQWVNFGLEYRYIIAQGTAKRTNATEYINELLTYFLEMTLLFR